MKFPYRVGPPNPSYKLVSTWGLSLWGQKQMNPHRQETYESGQGNSPSSGFPIDKRTQNLQQIQDLVSLGNCRPCPLPVLPQRVAKLPATASEIWKCGCGFWFQVMRGEKRVKNLYTILNPWQKKSTYIPAASKGLPMDHPTLLIGYQTGHPDRKC